MGIETKGKSDDEKAHLAVSGQRHVVLQQALQLSSLGVAKHVHIDTCDTGSP